MTYYFTPNSANLDDTVHKEVRLYLDSNLDHHVSLSLVSKYVTYYAITETNFT